MISALSDLGFAACGALVCWLLTRRTKIRWFVILHPMAIWGWLLIVLSIGLATFAAWSPVQRYVALHSVPWREMTAIIAGGLALCGLSLIILRRRPGKARPIPESSSLTQPTKSEDGYPREVVRTASRVKAVLQMVVGVYALGWLVWAFYLSHHIRNCAPLPTDSVPVHQQLCYFIPSSGLILQVIADALAVATAIQLVYTLFTPGPDEALDPILLAVAAALLLQLGKVEKFSWGDGVAIILYSVALGILFVVRVFIAPDEDGPPKLWWWKK